VNFWQAAVKITEIHKDRPGHAQLSIILLGIVKIVVALSTAAALYLGMAHGIHL